MTGLYLFCLAVGGPLLVWFAFAGDADGSGGGDAEADGPLSIIPLSSLAFVLAFFGLSGLVLDTLGTGVAATVVIAAVVAVIAGALNSAAFAYLRRSSSSSHVDDVELEGLIATASLPISADHRGKVVLQIAGARESMTARPADGSVIEVGQRVVIVGVERGVAVVAPLGPELELGRDLEDSP